MTTLTAILAHPLTHLILALAIILAFIGLNGVVLVYLERKVVAWIQRRPGPFEVGPHGILQPVADAIKMVGKQLVTPRGADNILFWGAPLVSFTPAVLCFLPLPFSPLFTGMEVNMGLILILAFSGFNVVALCMAGWGANNKYALVGAARAVSQSVAYEIPLLLSALAVAFQAGSVSLSEITAGQSSSVLSWNIFTQPLAFFIFFVSATAETNRAPFDLPEAESELTAGYHTEYAGMGFGLFMLAEYSYMIVICSVATSLFLGGWHGPVASGIWWFLAKFYGLMIIMMWMRWTFPRVRFDQLLNVCWKWLIPLSLANLVATALVIKLVK